MSGASLRSPVRRSGGARRRRYRGARDGRRLPDVDWSWCPPAGEGCSRGDLGGEGAATRGPGSWPWSSTRAPGSALRSLRVSPCPCRGPGTLADGMTPPFVGALPLAIAREAVDEIVTVTEAEMIDAMKLLMTRAKLYVEASGAAATAAMLSGKVRARRGERTVSIVSGANVDLERVAAIVSAPFV